VFAAGSKDRAHNLFFMYRQNIGKKNGSRREKGVDREFYSFAPGERKCKCSAVALFCLREQTQAEEKMDVIDRRTKSNKNVPFKGRASHSLPFVRLQECSGDVSVDESA